MVGVQPPVLGGGMMHYLYIDWETRVGPKLSLSCMTLREYLAQTDVLSVAWAFDGNAVNTMLATDPAWPALVAGFAESCADPDVTIVAHNASFDVRVLTQKLGCPWPQHIHCTMELAQAWSPNQPGGYSLENLGAIWLPQHQRKAHIDLMRCTPQELLAYNAQDVEACRALHQIALSRVPAQEIRVHEATQQIKELTFTVDQSRIASAVQAFTQAANAACSTASTILGDTVGFNFDGDDVRSVKPADIKQLLLANLGFEAPTISEKKLNPERLRQNAQAASAIHAVTAVNKTLSHKRRVRAFSGLSEIDCELTYFAAHTGRFSSRNSGRGLNLHNLPKRNPAIAKPVRELFALPSEYAFVRGDFANVEYRVEGLLTGCDYVRDLFTQDVLADPYATFWTAATGQPCSKKDPARQLAKAAVLGLGYLMGIQRWMEELLRGLADPTFGVSLADLDRVCATNGWGHPSDPRVKAAMTKLNAPWQVAAVAFETRERFHRVHPEIMRTARWLDRAVTKLSAHTNPALALGELYADPAAPDRQLLGLSTDDWLQGRSVLATCGPGWHTPTVTWRDLLVRQTKMGAALTFVRAGRRPPVRASANICLENCVQSAARNALCMGLLELQRRGYPYILHVHDEVMLVVPRDRDELLRAKATLLDVFGPGGWISTQGWGWSVVIKPGDVTMSKTLYESEAWAAAAWPRLEQGDLTVLQELP